MTMKRATPSARRLRSDPTDAEALLWSHLRDRRLAGHKFVRQFPIGPYKADFACRSARIVVELDGGQHAQAQVADAARTAHIAAFGFLVVRYWHNEVLQNPDGVLQDLLRHLTITR